MRKSELDKNVAVLLGMKLRSVSLVTDTFLKEIAKALADEGEVHLQGLGKLRVVKENSGRTENLRLKRGQLRLPIVTESEKYKVYFSKAQPLREEIQRGRLARETRNGKTRSR